MSTTTGIFELLTGSSTPLLASGDVVCFIDISDATQAPQGSLVKGTLTQFFAAIPVPVVITSASANALAVGLNGATNSAFQVDASTALQAAGLKVTGAVAAGTVAVAVISSGADANLIVNAKGAGTIGIGSVSTGRVTITPVVTITGALTQTGLATFNGGATVASGQTLTVTGATITGLTAASVGTGTFPGVYTVTGALTLSAALTYGGVTLSNAVTGTGNMVLSASPTLTGTVAGASSTWSGSVGIGGIGTTFPLGVRAAADKNFFVRDNSGLEIGGFTNANADIAMSLRGTSISLATGGTSPVVVTNAGAVSGITTLTASSTIRSTGTGGWAIGDATASVARIEYGSTVASTFSFIDAGNAFAPIKALSATFAGALSGITTLTAGSVNTGSGSTSNVLNNTPTTIVAAGQAAGFYIVWSHSAAYGAKLGAVVFSDGSQFSAVGSLSVVNGSISVDGSGNLTVTQGTGSTQTMSWGYVRIA